MERQLFARMTPTAWRRGVMNALIVCSILLVSWTVAAGLIWSVFHRSFRESSVLAWGILTGTSLLLWLGTVPRHIRDWIRKFSAGGRVLIDCGPVPMRAFLFGVSACWAVLGLTLFTAFFAWSKLFAFDNLVTGVLSAFFLLFAFFSLTLALGRLQIREDGLWQYCGLIRWEKIESMQLTDDSTLLIDLKTCPSFLGHGAIPIPPEHKDALQELLRKKQCLVWDRDF
jgi:hypothetical protein